jgi:GDP-L-fucose synthase
MPTNLYGPGDSYDLNNSHVLPALVRKMHEAMNGGLEEAVIWGTGSPMREFLYSADMAEACVYLLELPDEKFEEFVSDTSPPLVNIGYGEDQSIAELARTVARVVGFRGRLRFDTSKPDGTPRKLLDSARINALGWRPRTRIDAGIAAAYKDFLSRYAG